MRRRFRRKRPERTATGDVPEMPAATADPAACLLEPELWRLGGLNAPDKDAAGASPRDYATAPLRRRHLPGHDRVLSGRRVDDDVSGAPGCDGRTIHALIQVTDSSAPPLTSFQRVIVTVRVPRR